MDPSGQSLVCPACGKQFAWKPELAGRRVACKCGQVFQAPDAPPAEESYDIAEDPAPPAQTPAAPKNVVLTYESVEEVKEERRRFRMALLREWRPQDAWLPISLIILALGCKLLFPLASTTGGTLRAIVVLSLVALATVFNVLVMLLALTISARLTDLEVGHPAQAIVKLGLMFVAAVTVGGLIANFAKFDSLGIGVGVNAIILIYWVLFALLFKAGVIETMMTIAITCILQGVLNLAIWRM